MEENVARDGIVDTDMGEIQVGEIPNEDLFVVYLQRDRERSRAARDARKLHDIGECKKYRAEHCICSSKIHYEIDGSVLCARDMKPFIYINKMSILCKSKNKKSKRSMET